MSRFIENDHLWDEFEVRYQLDRNRVAEVEENREKFAKDAVKQLDSDVFEFVKELDEEGLKEQLQKYNIDPENHSVKELKMAVAQKIQAEKDAAE